MQQHIKLHPYHIRALYKRFILIGHALESNRVPQYQRRCHLESFAPPELESLLAISSRASRRVSHSWSRSILRKEIGQSIIHLARHLFRKPLKSKNPATAIEEATHQAEVNQLFSLGVRTLYFIEKAAGLRPYVFYHNANTSTSANNVISHHLPPAMSNMTAYPSIIPLTSQPESLRHLPQQTQIIVKQIAQYYQQHKDDLLATPKQRELFLQNLSPTIRDELSRFKITTQWQQQQHQVNPEYDILHRLACSRYASRQRHSLRGNILTASQYHNQRQLASILSQLQIALWFP